MSKKVLSPQNFPRDLILLKSEETTRVRNNFEITETNNYYNLLLRERNVNLITQIKTFLMYNLFMDNVMR